MNTKLFIVQMDDGNGWHDLGSHTHFETLDTQISIIKDTWKNRKKRPKFRQLTRRITVTESEINEIYIGE